MFSHAVGSSISSVGVSGPARAATYRDDVPRIGVSASLVSPVSGTLLITEAARSRCVCFFVAPAGQAPRIPSMSWLAVSVNFYTVRFSWLLSVSPVPLELIAMGKRPGSRLARVELGATGVWRDHGRSSSVSGGHSLGDASGVSGIAHAMSCASEAAPAPTASTKAVGRLFILDVSVFTHGCARHPVAGRPSQRHDDDQEHRSR